MTPPVTMYDICITASRDVELVKEVMHGLYRYLLHPVIDQCRLVIHIEPVGSNCPSHLAAASAASYFSRYVIGMPLSTQPGDGLIWCWRYVQSPWIIHWPETSLLTTPVEIQKLIAPLQNSTKAGVVSLVPKGNEHDSLFRGLPAVMSRRFVASCLPYLKPGYNGEQQLNNNIALRRNMRKWGRFIEQIPGIKKAV